MTIRRLHRVVLALCLLQMLSGPRITSAEEPTFKIPSHLSRYDLATPDDLVFSYMLSPLFESPDTSKWSIVYELKDQVGGWIENVLASSKMAETITTAMPIEGQPLHKLEEIVKRCSQILHLKAKPTVYVRNSEEQRVYSVRTANESYVIVTSGLLKLYDGKPSELRFAIGRELGHLKADHEDLKRAGFAVLNLIRAVDTSVIPDKFQTALPTLAFGRLLNWIRESEITADRAGLLCCQDPQAAYSALMRQMHGLPATLTIFDPNDPAFDENRIIKNFEKWQFVPFVKFVVHAKRFSADSPFIPDRLAALKAWVKTGRYEEILARNQPPGRPKILTVETIVLRNLSVPSAEVRPYLIAKSEGGETLFTTKIGPPKSDVSWERIGETIGTTNGQPLFFEVWESRTGWDRLLGGFYVQTVETQTDYIVAIARDWNERVTDTSPGLAKVRVRVQDKVGINAN